MGQKLLFTCILSFLYLGIHAQSQSKLDISMRYLEQNVEQLNLTTSDIESAVVNYQYTNKATGATYIYLNQAHNGVKVKNAILNLAINKNGRVVHVGNNFVTDLASKVSSTTSTIEPKQAVVKAAEFLGVQRPEAPTLASRSNEGIYKFNTTNFTNSDILVEQVYDVTKSGIKLTWQSTLNMKSNADYWEIRMDANTGEFVSKNNLTVYCTHEKGKYSNHTNCTGHKLSTTMAEAKTVEAAIAQGVPSYRVYPFPGESPNHTAHQLVVNPAIASASPYGWHDTNGIDGAEFTTTQGNNVHAYSDKDDDNSPDDNTPSPDGGEALVFDFVHDQTLNPTESPDAAMTNLFYVVNMLHDITHSWGFDEVSGNFQRKNYTNEGTGGDHVLAQAFDGFELTTPSLNNANFATPPDGNNGVMQMFLWEASEGAVSVDSPSEIAGFYEYSSGSAWGGIIPAALEPAITGRAEVVYDGNIASPTTGCKEIENDLFEKVALIDRGLCDFSLKAYNAQTKGAIAVIICNIAGVNGGDGEEFVTMAAGDNADLVTIPSVFFKKSDCDKIKLSLSNNIDVILTFQERENSGPDYSDGNYDNGIIAHEFGHGVSNRLVGGPNSSGCLGSAEQMGEGWSDFIGLVMTMKDGDKGTDARGVGTYAVGEPVNGRGIRRFPYSTDMNINPQTYDDLKLSGEVHNVGEIWTDMLWDLHWSFIDLYGWDADWANAESGNSKSMQLVTEGMKLFECGGGFVEGRNAILAADDILFDGIHLCQIWEVFARRGLGYFADGGDPDDTTDGSEDFESLPTCIQALKIRKTATGFIEAGDEIAVSLTATNHIPQKMAGVVVTDELPEGATFLASTSSIPGTVSGNIISFELGDMEFEDEVIITYKIKSSSDLKSTRLKFFDFEDGGEDWFISRDVGFTSWNISFNAYKSFESSYRIGEETAENDHSLISPPLAITGTKPVLKFWHRYKTQSGIDGGFIQISSDNGVTWNFTKTEDFVRNAYNSGIDYSTLAIPGLSGFTGSSNNNFIDSYLDLTPYVGNDVLIRFRYGSEELITSGDEDFGGWFIDDVELLDILTYKSKACITESTNMHGACTLPLETIVNSDASNATKNINYDHFGVTLAPNPAGNYVTINASSSINENADVVITSMEGKVVYKSTMYVSPRGNVHTINTTAFPAGFYLVKVQNGLNQTTQKLIIN